MITQNTIDDISDLLQGRDSEHREYPFGHPKYRPEPGAQLPYVPGSGSRVTIDFGSDQECARFAAIFSALDRNAKDRTIQHLQEIGRVEHGI